MKFKNLFWHGQTTGETLAIFGAARLIKKLNGKIELIGGTADDHADAREWCSLFAPEVVFIRRDHKSLDLPCRSHQTPLGNDVVHRNCSQLSDKGESNKSKFPAVFDGIRIVGSCVCRVNGG